MSSRRFFLKSPHSPAKPTPPPCPTKREGLTEQENIDIAFRVLADHARCVSCAIADGILPSNEGRNYVIRRILRRGILYGKKLGLQTGFFEQLVGPVVESLGGVFPELKQREDIVRRAIRSEVESFGRTLEKGLAVFQAEIASFPGSARVPRAASGVSPDASEDAHYTKRNLPHFERPWGKYHLTFTTHQRRALAPAERRIVLDSLVHGHTQGRYHLFAACVMPDHVHALLEPQPSGRAPDGTQVFHAVPEILHSVKSFTAHEINKAAGMTGPVWEKETFDRLIRGENDLHEKFRYIVDNPRADNLVGPHEDYPFLWTPPEGIRRDAESSPRDAGAPREISGAIAFQLYDTYGFPLDMTQLLATERVDSPSMSPASRSRWKSSASAAVLLRRKEIIVAATEGDGTALEATKFLGYEQTTAHAKLIDVVKAEKDTFLVFDQTPFYAEMGGQTGDTGEALIAGTLVHITDCVKDKAGRHLHKVDGSKALSSQPLAHSRSAQPPRSPSISPVVARLTVTTRPRTLIHWALRKVLGTHVRQAGTSKTADRMRFDFLALRGGHARAAPRDRVSSSTPRSSTTPRSRPTRPSSTRSPRAPSPSSATNTGSSSASSTSAATAASSAAART